MMWDVQLAFSHLLLVGKKEATCVIFVHFQSVAYNLYEIPLFIAMGAIGKVI